MTLHQRKNEARAASLVPFLLFIYSEQCEAADIVPTTSSSNKKFRLASSGISSISRNTITLTTTKHDVNKKCEEDGNFLKLHHGGTNDDHQHDVSSLSWEEDQTKFMNSIYKSELAPGTLPPQDHVDDEEHQLLTPALLDATFVYWGLGMSDENQDENEDVTGIHSSMSFWNSTHVIGPQWNSKKQMADGTTQQLSSLHQWSFTEDAPVSDSDDLEDFVSRTKVLDSRFHYIVLTPLLASPTGGVSPEESFVNHIGYLAYLKHKYGFKNTKFVIAETSTETNQHKLRHMLDAFDPEFSKRKIEWIECPSDDMEHCNYLLKGGRSLQVLRPHVSPKHVDLMTLARTWMDDVKNKSHWWSHYDGDSTELVLYFKPKKNTQKSFAFLKGDDERDVLNTIRVQFQKSHSSNHGMKRNVQVITLDEEHFSQMTFRDQMALLHRAVMVVGSHDVAPYLMFTKTREVEDSKDDENVNCEGATKKPIFLELLPNTSIYANTVHSQYATLPWMDCHLIMMDYDQFNDEFQLNLEVMEHAMKQVLGTDKSSNDDDDENEENIDSSDSLLAATE